MPQMDRLEEVLKLIAETGDRVVVLAEGHDPYVLMNIGSYRTLLQTAAKKQDLRQLSEGELLDRIDQQIAEWREVREREIADYSLAEFRVDDRQQRTEGSQQGYSVEKSSPSRRPQPDLPIVEDDAPAEEYRLEPLS